MKQETKIGHNIELIEKTLPLKKKHSNTNVTEDEYTIEEAISLTGHGKFQLLVLIVSGISVLQIVIDGVCMAIVLPIAKCELGISTVEQGFLNSIACAGTLIASQLWGLTTDILGRRKTLQISLLISFFVSTLSSFSLNSWMLIICRFIVAISTSGIKLASCAYLGEFLSQNYRSKYFGMLVCCTSFGQVVQSTIALSILPLDFEYNLWFGIIFKPWRLYILIGSLISGLAYIGLYFLPEGPQFLFTTNDHEGCLKTLQKMYSINSGMPKEQFLVKKMVSEHNNYRPNQSTTPKTNKGIGCLNLIWDQIWPLFSSNHLLSLITLCVLGSIGFGITQTLQAWYPQILVYYTNYRNMSITMCDAVNLGHSATSLTLNVTTATNLINSTIPNCNIPIKTMAYQIGLFNGLFGSCTSLLISFIIEKIGKKIILISWVLIAALASMLLIWITEFYISILLLSIIISSMFTTDIIIFIGCDLFPTKYKGVAISLVLMITRLGSVVGINLAVELLFNHCNGLQLLNTIMEILSIIGYFYILWKLDKIKSEVSETNIMKNSIENNCDIKNETKLLLKTEKTTIS